ncbi:hypothetical protein M1563_05320 [Patescibacteria group bacterium]|nr:hypothetical protein [Patescibacteria group bacterium]MCL5409312.1 hypothetical protein [Patescibacteria group bacterium]
MSVLKVKIVTPKATIFQGDADSVSSTNSSGKFDILPEHANFVTLINNHPITLCLANQQTKSFTFPLAIIYTHNNQIDIYTDITLQLENISNTTH